MRSRALARVVLVAGIVAVVVGASKVHAARNQYDYTGSFRFAWSFALIAMLAVASYGAGLPDLPRSLGGAARASAAVLSVAGIGISLIQLFLGDALLPRFVLGAAVLLLFPWFVVCWTLASRDRGRQEARDLVFFVGSAADGALLAQDLLGDVEIPARLVGQLAVEAGRSPVAGDRPLTRAVRSARATVVVLSRDAQSDDLIVHQAAELHESGIRIRTLSLFYEQWMGKLPLSELERVSLMYDISELHRAVYGRASRVLDVVIATFGVPVLAMAIPVVALGNLVANRGPIFYRQCRVGKNGHRFSILKFRTMQPSAEGVVNEWTTEDDPRVTPFGRLMRRTHIDEVPQLVNVLRGELSLVGPRPEQPHYVDELVTKLPFYGLRHLVRPGLTGWAQVKYGYAGTESDALEKLQYEFYYLRHQTLALDGAILIRTLRRVLGAQGR
jgi:lipopolysaccharide/colanic/teichoic acid biosynthesis glycosyltransferase